MINRFNLVFYSHIHQLTSGVVNESSGMFDWRVRTNEVHAGVTPHVSALFMFADQCMCIKGEMKSVHHIK